MIEIRSARREDKEEIHDLWHTVFGDGNEFIDSFYARCCPLEQTLVLRENGVLRTTIAAPLLSLRTGDGTTVNAAYLYALATHPDARSQGFGHMVLQYVDYFLKEHKVPCCVLVPAEPGLFRFFASSGYDSAFAINQIEVPASAVKAPAEGTSLEVAGSVLYNELREQRLESTFHITYSDAMVAFQKDISITSGGDIYRLVLPHGEGVAAAEYTEGNSLVVKELLAPEGDLNAALSLLASALPADRYYLRYPVFVENGLPGDYGQPFGVIKWYNDALYQRWGNEKRGYLGLAFD